MNNTGEQRSTIEAMKQALEALKMCRGLIRNNIAEGVAISSPNPFFSADVDNAITTLRTAIAEAESRASEQAKSKTKEQFKTDRFVRQLDEAIEQAEKQEPVAWMDGYQNIYTLEEKAAGCEDAVIPLVPAIQHWSDCAVHNEPAYPKGDCDCGGYTTPPAAPVQDVDWQKKWADEFEKRGAEVAALERKIAELTSAQRQWVGLTPEDEEVINRKINQRCGGWIQMVREADAMLREKNGAQS